MRFQNSVGSKTSGFGMEPTSQLVNVPASAAVQINSILLTAASNQYINFGNNFRFTPTQAFWMEFWWFPTNLALSAGVLISNYTPASNAFYQFYQNTTALAFEMYGDSSSTERLTVSVGAGTLKASQWNHIVVTKGTLNNANDIDIYVNDVKKSVTVTHNDAIGTPHYAAATWFGNDSANDSNSGYLNRASFGNRKLAQGDIDTLWNNGKPGSIAGFSGLTNSYLPGNGNDTASTVFDLTGSINGTIVNSAPYKGFAPFAFHLASSNQVYAYPSVSAPISGGNMFVAYYQSGGGQDAPYATPDDLQVFSLPSLTSIGELPTTFGVYGTTTPQPPIVVDGNFCYIGYYKGTTKYLNVIDISIPSNPSVIATIDSGISNLQPAGVFKYGNIIYQPGSSLTGGNNKLLITDVTDPSIPIISTMTIPDQVANGWAYITFIGAYMYLAVGGVIKIYSITTPASPSLVATFTPTGGSPYFMRQNGNYLFLAEYAAQKLEILDISTVTAPVSVKVISTATKPNAINFLGNNVVLVAEGTIANDGAVEAYTLYDPANSFLAGSFSQPVNGISGHQLSAYGLEISGNNAYVLTADFIGGTSGVDFYGFINIYNL